MQWKIMIVIIIAIIIMLNAVVNMMECLLIHFLSLYFPWTWYFVFLKNPEITAIVFYIICTHSLTHHLRTRSPTSEWLAWWVLWCDILFLSFQHSILTFSYLFSFLQLNSQYVFSWLNSPGMTSLAGMVYSHSLASV